MRRNMLGGGGGLRGQPARSEPSVGCCLCRGVEYISESERNSAIRRCLVYMGAVSGSLTLARAPRYRQFQLLLRLGNRVCWTLLLRVE